MLDKKMLKIIFLMTLVLVTVSMLSLSTLEPSLTTLSVLSLPFTLGDGGHTTSILENIQYCPYCY